MFGKDGLESAVQCAKRLAVEAMGMAGPEHEVERCLALMARMGYQTAHGDLYAMVEDLFARHESEGVKWARQVEAHRGKLEALQGNNRTQFDRIQELEKKIGALALENRTLKTSNVALRSNAEFYEGLVNEVWRVVGVCEVRIGAEHCPDDSTGDAVDRLLKMIPGK